MVFEQDFVPRRAARELGLETGSKVLFFAGGAGDWADCLARESIRIFFTDKSKEIINSVKAKFPASFVEIKQIDAMKFRIRNRDLMLISFEPLPMYGNLFILFLLRALSFAKGVIIIQRAYLHPHPNREFSFVSYLYGLRAICSRTTFVCRIRGGKRFKKTSLLVYSAVARTRNRKLMEQDLQEVSRLLGTSKHKEEIQKKAKLHLRTRRTGRTHKILKFIADYNKSVSGFSPRKVH